MNINHIKKRTCLNQGQLQNGQCYRSALMLLPLSLPSPNLYPPPLGLQNSPGKEVEKGGRGLGLPENEVSSGSPSLASMPHKQPRFFVPRLLVLPTLTLSPSDPLSRWASSKQQPQQQHIPIRAMPSSKEP